MKVFADKKCTNEIINPQPGQTGWREREGSPGEIECVVYDKGGKGRSPLIIGKTSYTYEDKPAWVTLPEHELRKAGRSRLWKKIKGVEHWKTHRRAFSEFRERCGGGVYDEEHPHAFA